MMQPAFFADPTDLALRSEDQAFLVGADLLVVSTWAEAPKLPQGIWREVSLLPGDQEKDHYQPTLKVRGDAIIPLGRVIQSTNEASLTPLTLLVCLDAAGHAKGDLYEDAGDGFGCTRGEYAFTHCSAVRENDTVTIKVVGRQGSLKTARRVVQVSLLNADGTVTGSGEEAGGIRVNLKSPVTNPAK